MNLFLRAKHWQIFLLTFGIPFVFQIVMMVSIFSSIAHDHNPTAFFSYFKFFPLMMLLFTGTMLGWQYSVAVGLQKFVPPNVKMKVTKFKIFFFIPVVYLSVIIGFISYLFTGHIPTRSGPPDPIFFSFFAIIFPIHLFSMFCLFYSLYFVSKTYKTVELQRAVTFSDFVGEFFMTWFFFVGIWIMQPKINKWVEERESDMDVIAEQ